MVIHLYRMTDTQYERVTSVYIILPIYGHQGLEIIFEDNMRYIQGGNFDFNDKLSNKNNIVSILAISS